MRIGVIGSGFGLYGLLPAFSESEGCEVVALCGKQSERLLAYSESIGLKKLYTSWETMLEEEQLDAVAIAVVPSVQYQIAKRAIEKGLHIFAEKPLSSTYNEALELLTLAEEKKIVTAVDFIFPEIDEWQKVKELLDGGVYGKLKHISVNWDFLSYDIKHKMVTWKSDTQKGGGALAFYVSHALYYMEHYCGEILKTKSTFSYLDKKAVNVGESGVDMLIEFKDDITGNLHFSSHSIGLNRHHVMFLCERATLILESYLGVTENFSLTVHTQDGQLKVPSERKFSEKNDEDERVKIVKKLVKKFIQGVKSGYQVKPSFVDGVRVQKLIEKIRAEGI